MRLMCFVDAPLAIIKGTPYERKLKVAVTILVWVALKFKLAYRRGQLSQPVTWIGGTLSVTSAGVTALVKDAIVDDIKVDLGKASALNIISRKDVCSLVGKLGLSQAEAARFLGAMR